MRLTTPDEFIRRVICFICERDATDVRFVDTRREFDSLGASRLDGRKRVCERCVLEMAHLFEDELVSREKYAKVTEAAAAFEVERDALIEENRSYAAVKDALAKLTPKPAPKRQTNAGRGRKVADASAD
jgi:hypothetical protein